MGTNQINDTGWVRAEVLLEELDTAVSTAEGGLQSLFEVGHQFHSVVSFIEQKMKEHLGHPEIGLQHLFQKPGIEQVIAFPPGVVAEIREEIGAFRKLLSTRFVERN